MTLSILTRGDPRWGVFMVSLLRWRDCLSFSFSAALTVGDGPHGTIVGHFSTRMPRAYYGCSFHGARSMIFALITEVIPYYIWCDASMGETPLGQFCGMPACSSPVASPCTRGDHWCR